jgi:outer membrane lipoprotein-sorting protein
VRWKSLAIVATLIPAVLRAAEPVGVANLTAAPAGTDGREIARRSEDVLRGDTAYLEAQMIIVSPRLPAPRTVTFRVWDDRPNKRSFIRILAPPKDAGTGFLKLHPNLWMYIPRVERTTRIPPSMMLQSWMGSDFTNDDLVRESSQLDDYEHHLLGIDAHPEDAPGLKAYVVDYVPHENAPVVWGRIINWIEMEHFTPLRSDYYDEKGARLRTMRFSDIREVQGRHFPYRWKMTPLDKQGYETTIAIDTIRFNEHFDEGIFTTRNLKRSE